MFRLVIAVCVMLLALSGGPVAAAPDTCVGLLAPVAGSVVEPFAPIGRYAGHWGLDLRAGPGTPVVAAAAGTVSFAGTVVANRAVSIDHGGGVVTTLSYLEGITVQRGQVVAEGTVIGASGLAHGTESVHLSVRIDGAYVDPAPLLGCVAAVPGDALRLVDEAR